MSFFLVIERTYPRTDKQAVYDEFGLKLDTDQYFMSKRSHYIKIHPYSFLRCWFLAFTYAWIDIRRYGHNTTNTSPFLKSLRLFSIVSEIRTEEFLNVLHFNRIWSKMGCRFTFIITKTICQISFIQIIAFLSYVHRCTDERTFRRRSKLEGQLPFWCRYRIHNSLSSNCWVIVFQDRQVDIYKSKNGFLKHIELSWKYRGQIYNLTINFNKNAIPPFCVLRLRESKKFFWRELHE